MCLQMKQKGKVFYMKRRQKLSIDLEWKQENSKDVFPNYWTCWKFHEEEK